MGGILAAAIQRLKEAQTLQLRQAICVMFARLLNEDMQACVDAVSPLSHFSPCEAVGMPSLPPSFPPYPHLSLPSLSIVIDVNPNQEES